MTQPDFNRITVVLNPTAGSDTALSFRKDVMDALMQKFPQADITMLHTSSAADPIRFGAEQQADLIVSLSGDGTVHGIVQGLMRRPAACRPALSVIPVGSGNDIARTFGISPQPAKAVRALAEGVTVPCDVGRVEADGILHYFMQTFSFGVDAAVALKTMELRKKTKQRESVLYARAAVDAILTELHANRMQFSLDGEQHDEQLLIMAVQNGPTYGGGFKVAPDARIDDGLLDVVTASKVSTPRALYCLSRMKGGKHLSLGNFNSYRASNIEIVTDKQLPIQTDGECMLGTRFSISVERGAIDVLAPPDAPVL